MITFFKNIFIGFLIGLGSILPGISSGVILVSLGLYEKLINSILSFFSNIKTNSKILFPIVLGTFIGVVLFGNILNTLYNSYPNISKYCFIGLILGTIPGVIKSANKNNNFFAFRNIIFSLISFSVSIILLLLEKNMTSSFFPTNQFNFLYLLLSGFFMSIGVVIPRNK